MVHPDIIFLDVEMPGMTGFKILEELKDASVNVIFNTTYDHYAIRAIRFSAIDYLLKPIDIQELKLAVRRFLNKPAFNNNTNPLLTNLLSNLKSIHLKNPRLTIPTTGGLSFLDIENIMRCEAYINYATFHLESKKRIISSKTLKEYDELLTAYHFLRVHQSHLVNPSYIKNYKLKGSIEMNDGTLIPVSRRNHHWVNEKLKNLYS